MNAIAPIKAALAAAVPLPGLRLEWAADFKLGPGADGLIAGLLGAPGVSVVYGEPGAGKTFFATDLALHVARGLEWRGRRTQHAGAVYVAGESASGLRQRVLASRAYHGIGEDIPFAMVPAAADLRSPGGDTERLIALVLEARASVAPLPLGLVVIDTLSRSLAGGNENDSADMGSLVRSVDRLRDATAAHVMLVHHCGKDAARGARGHSLLRGAVDTEIEVTREREARTCTARVTKQRELETGGSFAFALEPVEFESDGNRVKSCVVVPQDEGPPPAPARGLSPAQARALELLIDTIARHGEVPEPNAYIPPGRPCVSEEAWRQACYERDISGSDDASARRKAFVRAAKELMSRSRIGKYKQFVWVVPQRDRRT